MWNSGGSYAIDSDASTRLSFYSGSGTERMRIDSSGNVGIGTTSPSVKFQVNHSSDVAAINASGGGVTLGMSNSSANDVLLRMTNNSSNFWDIRNVYSSSNFVIGYNGTDRMTIDTSANTSFGGQGNFANSVSVFSTNPTSSQQGILLRNVFNVGPSIFSMGAATSNGIITFVGGAGTQGAINGNGSGINFVTTSDYRLKENVAPMTGALEKVAQLKPCTYTWKFDGSDGQGFIAHELQEIFPDAVTGKKDDVETYTDEDGNEQTRIKPQGVDTGFLVATLTSAIQELSAKVTALEEQVLNLGVK
jgi:hypothetical protein